MFNSNNNYKRKNISVIEDEPPEKKLISDADLYIKKLADKQRCIRTTLEEELLKTKEFYKATEFVPLTSYAAGSSSLKEFNLISKYSDEIEKLKSYDLCDDDILLYLDSKEGNVHLKSKHKNVNESVYKNRLEEINKIIESATMKNKASTSGNIDRLQKEMILAMKPGSAETKLLKFALENESHQKQRIPHPMDQIKDIEAKLSESLIAVDPKKIQKKVRNLQNQTNKITVPSIANPVKKPKNPPILQNSKWDIKESQPQASRFIIETKTYTCKPTNYYTIKDGKIIKLESQNQQEKNYETKRLSLEEIKKIPKFENYDAGPVSNILYLKNLANGVSIDDISMIMQDYKKEIQIKIMRGKMRGQAFIECSSEAIAQEIVNNYNGVILKNKPIIMQFSRSKKSQ